ncbi:MAG TPA: DUF5985 family protein [Verrucomicrobiae bacterium]|jgi:hypothetical protein|nr:DUF5985 family protein [Verrucomicrobiae bacterium]
MVGIVYLLCAATSLVCAGLLFRGYRRSRALLLFWVGLFFTCLTGENILLFLDNIIFTNVDLWWYRTSLALLAVLSLLYGMIWRQK